jgi:hypothetical protein
VHVLDDQGDRLLFRQGLEQGEEHLEEAGTGCPRVGARRRGTEIGQQHAQFACGLARQQSGHIRGAARPDQPAQGRGERRVGQAARAQLDTAPGENRGAVRYRRGELCDQPRLAASGFRTGQHRTRRTARRLVERASQQHELSLSARENRAHQASGHVPHDASPGSRAPPRCDPVRTAGP